MFYVAIDTQVCPQGQGFQIQETVALEICLPEKELTEVKFNLKSVYNGEGQHYLTQKKQPFYTTLLTDHG